MPLAPHQTRRPALSVKVEKFDAVHPPAQGPFGNQNLDRVGRNRERVEKTSLFAAKSRQSQQFAPGRSRIVGRNAHKQSLVRPLRMQCIGRSRRGQCKGTLRQGTPTAICRKAVGLRVRLFLFKERVAPGKIGRQHKRPHALVFHHRLAHHFAPFVANQQRVGERKAPSVRQLESHLLRHPLGPQSALGKERKQLFGAISLHVRARCTVSYPFVGRRFGNGQFVERQILVARRPHLRVGRGEHRENARKARRVVPVGHGAGVGPHLVVTGANRQVQAQRTVGLTE